MAIVSFLLTLYLSTQGGLTYQSRVVQGQDDRIENCCSDKNDDCELVNDDTQRQKDESNKCCTNGFCNPFEVCSCCFFIVKDAPLVYLSEYLPFARREKVTLTNDKILSLYVQDFWQPPETVSHCQRFTNNSKI